MDKKNIEQTLVLIKPDALKNSLTGYILSQLSEFHTGLRFAGTKIVHVGKMLAEEHYAEHRGKVFFPSLLEYIMGALHYPDQPEKHRVIAIVYQGPDAVKKIRDIVGPTNPHAAREQKPGCIRALGTVVPIKDTEGNVIGERMDNLIHASANDSDAEREIKLWFKPNDIPPFMHSYSTEASRDFYFFRENKLCTKEEPGSRCFIVPGETAWKSDLETLRLQQQGAPASNSFESVVAKYLINEKPQTT
ncbi:MAG: nucleoside-diphosphate kinase [Nitrospiraceae bacterium]|nr:MAG: nucleoside-diphosphate kinase [Nitrospiraceae bacterium]